MLLLLDLRSTIDGKAEYLCSMHHPRSKTLIWSGFVHEPNELDVEIDRTPTEHSELTYLTQN